MATASKNPSKRVLKYGPWAVVTGASSGMGREFARKLAGVGINLIVAARRLDRLEALAAELTTAHGVEIRTVQADLTELAGIEAVAKAAADVEIGLVVNNAGNASPGAFLKVPVEAQLKTIDLNVSAPLQLAYALGGQMVDQGRGGFIFVGSTSAFTGAPYIANYAATKAYLGSLAEGLRVEWAKHGVDVLVVHPGPTRTEMVEMDGVDLGKVPVAWMEAEAVAHKSLNALGRRSVLVPGAPNKFMRFVTTRLMPRRAAVAMWGSLMGRATDDELL